MRKVLAYPSLVLRMVHVAAGSSARAAAGLRSSPAAGRAYLAHARRDRTRAAPPSSPSNVK